MADRAHLLITAVDQTKSALDSAKRNLGRLADAAKSVSGILASMGVAASAAGFTALIKDAIDAADQISKLAQKIGISVEALSTLRFAAQLSGVSLESLQTGIKKLSQSITEANSGMGDGVKLFAALGISAKNADGSMKSTEAVLLEVANVFAELEDGAVKSSLAVALFGKSGLDMIPFLNQGAAGISQLTGEAERLGLKLTTETARSAEAFNDNLTALQASVSSLGIALARDFLPELTNISNAMRTAANEAGTLTALWVGLGGVGSIVFNGTEIKRARDEVARLQNLVDESRKIVKMGTVPVPFLPFDIKANDAAMASARRVLAEREKMLADAQQRLEALTNPKRPDVKPPTGKPTDDLQRIACTISGGQWINGKCEKNAAAGKAARTAPDTAAAQAALLKSGLDAEFALLKDGLARQQAVLDAALDDRLIAVRDYYAQKTAIEQREIDAEIDRQRALLAEQQRIASTGKTENDRLRAKAEVAKLESDLIVLNNRRADIEQANARRAAQAERELADALAQVREELAAITGTATDADRRAAIERGYRDLKARLLAEGDAGGVALVDRLIDVKAAQDNLQRLEAEWRLTTERLRNAQDAIQTQQQAGLLTETQARQQVVALQQQSAVEMERLLPLMQQAAQAIGPEAVTRVQAWQNELARTKLVVDDVAVAINGAVESGFARMFESVITGAASARDAFRAFALSVIQAIQKIAAQKLAELLFGGFKGGGIGGFVSSLLSGKGFAFGGYVTGPGTSTSDSIPARLSAGEYVVRAAAVKQVGVAFLDAINGLSVGPRWSGSRLAFAAGGLVPDVAQAQAAAPSQSVRIVNVIDPSMAADYLNSSAGERTILNVLSRNGSAVRELLR